MFAPARADVAQLVEQRFRKPQVTGSNPVVGSSLRLERNTDPWLRSSPETQMSHFQISFASDALQELRLGRRSIANCWDPTIERWPLGAS
jgi:hypothetical protein